MSRSATTKHEKPASVVEAAIVAIAHLRVMDGVSRTISTICSYFNDRTLVITDVYNRGVTHSVSEQSFIFEISPSHWGRKFFLLSIIEILSASIKIKKIVATFGVRILSAHGYESLVCSCIVKLLSHGHLKVSWQVYDEEELSKEGPLLSKLVVRAGLVDQILVLSGRMKEVVQKVVRLTPVSVLRLGVCRELMELSELPADSFRSLAERFPHLSRMSRDGRVILYFHGVLVPRRRLEDIMHAMVVLKDKSRTSKLILYVGGDLNFDRPYVHRLRQLAGELNLVEDVVFLGSLKDDETVAFMYTYCDIFVFPCEDQSWGLAPLEAMLFRKPVIVTSDVGVSEVLGERDLALIVPPRKPEILAHSIARMAEDERLRRELAVTGHEFVKHNLTYVSTGIQLEELWRGVARTKTRPRSFISNTFKN